MGNGNPKYSDVFVFDNDFPALRDDDFGQSEDTLSDSDDDHFVSQPESGICRVVCFSENHSLTLSQMSSAEIVPVIQCFRGQTYDLLAKNDINHVQIFENRGAVMGCSNPHPHAQIWAQTHTPIMPAR